MVSAWAAWAAWGRAGCTAALYCRSCLCGPSGSVWGLAGDTSRAGHIWVVSTCTPTQPDPAPARALPRPPPACRSRLAPASLRRRSGHVVVVVSCDVVTCVSNVCVGAWSVPAGLLVYCLTTTITYWTSNSGSILPERSIKYPSCYVLQQSCKIRNPYNFYVRPPLCHTFITYFKTYLHTYCHVCSETARWILIKISGITYA